jgi:chromosome segregation ATPase
MDAPHSEYPPDHPQAKPDIYTNAWWRTQFRGVQHSLNRCNAEYASAQDQIDVLKRQMADAIVEIGKLREELETSLERVREAYRNLKQSNGAH